MPRITENQKAILITRILDGEAIRTIANELGIDKNTVLLAKKKLQRDGSIRRKQGSGRSRISTEDDDTRLVNFLRENPFDTAVKAKDESRFPGSIITARRRIRKTELRNYCAANKFFLTPVNKTARLEFAQHYLGQDNFWQNVIFSDEKIFKSYHDGRLRVYRPRAARYSERYVNSINRTGYFSVNVWAWISSRGRGVCLIVQDRLTANVYKNILENVMLPSVTNLLGENFTFQHVKLNTIFLIWLKITF